MNLTHKKRALLSLALATGLLIPAMAAGPAQAHDALQSTSPAADTTVTSTPETVSLTLSEPPTDSASLNLSVITVTDGEGRTISDGKVTVTGATISTKVTPGANGAHKVLWRAVSSDGHPIDGNYAFTVQNPSRTATASPAQTSAPASAGSTEVEPAKGPNNDNALLTLGVAAAVIAALAGILFLARRKRAGNVNS
ncbi:copper resistance CopC family protein [Arthrobacter sp. PsM3]|uniref:copper resistance CopC family protein n=1 Tax=Arthrobacter sp. PsM3 TaxID=3030531 RepID=UPI00263B6895|nr:copper resistance CopC family protein [Arthrobacter sp. PsM3]MDN4646094.1 copper resistance protein CopC [Arthrobacter sp. PsM3]